MRVWIERRRSPGIAERVMNCLMRRERGRREFVAVSLRRLPRDTEIPDGEIVPNSDGLRVWRR